MHRTISPSNLSPFNLFSDAAHRIHSVSTPSDEGGITDLGEGVESISADIFRLYGDRHLQGYYRMEYEPGYEGTPDSWTLYEVLTPSDIYIHSNGAVTVVVMDLLIR